MFFVVFTAILALLHVHIGWRMLIDTRVPQPYRLIGLLMLGGLCLLVPVSIMLNTVAPRALSFAAHTWLGCLFYLWLFFVLRDTVAVGLWLVRSARRLFTPRAGAAVGGVADAASRPASETGASPDAPSSPGRRVFLSRAVTTTAALATVGIGSSGVHSALGEITLPKVDVKLARLPKALDGFRIAQLSDVHIGALLGPRFLRHVVDQTNHLRPDLIVITGDLVDGTVKEIGHTVALLQKLRARYGVAFVTGNHEYYSGADAWLEFLPKLGIRVLQNECVSIGDTTGKASFDLIGVPDQTAKFADSVAADTALAARGRDPERELVVLAHQPLQFESARLVGAGLHLAGHTHGGQVQPFGEVVSLVQPYVAGLHREGASQIYVSRGTGFWGPPMRVGAPAEITTLNLVQG